MVSTSTVVWIAALQAAYVLWYSRDDSVSVSTAMIATFDRIRPVDDGRLKASIADNHNFSHQVRLKA